MPFNLWARISYFLKDFGFFLILIFASFAFFLLAIYKIFKSKTSERKKKLLSSLTFLFLIFILTFSAFEAYFRYIYDEPDGLGFLLVNNKWQERHVVYNNYFFRDRDFNPVKREGTTRIGVLGDSVAFGGGIENVNDRFSNILERKLKSKKFLAKLS